jgi:hypothetical protein
MKFFYISNRNLLLTLLHRDIKVCISIQLRSSKFFLQYFILATLQTPRRVCIIITDNGTPVFAITVLEGIIVPVSS